MGSNKENKNKPQARKFLKQNKKVCLKDIKKNNFNSVSNEK